MKDTRYSHELYSQTKEMGLSLISSEFLSVLWPERRAAFLVDSCDDNCFQECMDKPGGTRETCNPQCGCKKKREG